MDDEITNATELASTLTDADRLAEVLRLVILMLKRQGITDKQILFLVQRALTQNA